MITRVTLVGQALGNPGGWMSCSPTRRPASSGWRFQETSYVERLLVQIGRLTCSPNCLQRRDGQRSSRRPLGGPGWPLIDRLKVFGGVSLFAELQKVTHFLL